MERGRERLEPLDHGTLFLKALDSLNFRVTVDDLLTFILPLKGEIGRASCRERVSV